MKSLYLLILSLLTSSLFAQTGNTPKSINKFSFKLFEQVYNKNNNCFLSPYSVFGALSLTQAGALGPTRDEMNKALEIVDDKDTPENFRKLVNDLNSNKDIELLTSNSVWISKQLKLKKSFAKLSKEYYEAKSESVDFANDKNREKARKEINNWVENKTNKQIKKFLKPGILNASTGMVLVNAVYFKGLWDNEFKKSHTEKADFIAASGNKVSCKMMSNIAKTNYFEDSKIQAIELPYKEKSASMIIFLPKEQSGFDIQKIDYEYYSDVIRSFSEKHVNINIPKFKSEINYELKKPINKLGINKAFVAGADFSGITGGKDLVLSKIIHQSVIDVTEVGTEASSATAVIAVRSAMAVKDQPVIFKADRPFLYLIKEKKTDTIIFIGYMADPSL